MTTVAHLIPSRSVRRRRPFRLWLKRLGLGLLGMLVVLTTTGLLYQAGATAVDRRSYPAPGQLLEVNGFTMHLNCVGTGGPTVVLEAMSGGFSSYWAWVQPAVAAQTRVCAYDRAGYGWSNPDPQQPETLERTARQLHSLLEQANVAGPFVLVGHSKGGLYVREFAALYASEVSGLVLLDAGHPDQFDRHPEWLAEETALVNWMPAILGAIQLGVGHAFFAAGGEMDFADLPARPHAEIAAALASPGYWASQAASMHVGAALFKQAQALGGLGDLPLAVITRGEAEPAWRGLQAELAALSTNSVALTVAGATHSSLVFNPDHAAQVSAAILAVVAAARTGQPLAAR